MSILLSVYVAGLVAWTVARALWGDQWVVALAVSQMGPWLFLPALFFAPWVILSRHGLGAILLAIPAGLFLWLYGAMLLPPRTAPEPALPLTVVTFNMQATNPDVEALVRVLEMSAADVAALQEVHGWQDTALGAALAERYPHRWRAEGAGLAVYSAHPMVARQLYEIPSPGGGEPAWPIQSVVLQVRGTPVHVVNAHLARTGIVPLLGRLDAGPMRDWAADRAAQIDQIGKIIRERKLPAIVACDGNMTDLTAAYADITANLRDAWRERGWGLGHTLLAPRSFEVSSPVNLAVQRIDYLFYTPEIQAGRVRVLSHDSGSDHRPVWAQFDLDPASAGKDTGRQ